MLSKEFLRKPKDNRGDKNKVIKKMETSGNYSYSNKHSPSFSHVNIKSDAEVPFNAKGSYYLIHHIQLSTRNTRHAKTRESTQSEDTKQTSELDLDIRQILDLKFK